MERLQEATAAESSRLCNEVSELEEKSKTRVRALRSMNCERLVEHNHMISTKDEEMKVQTLGELRMRDTSN